MDPLSLLVGAGILAVGLLAGYISGRVAAARRRKPDPGPICGCGHHLSSHDRETGQCHTLWLVTRQEHREGTSRKWQERVQCTCRQYVGPEPISSVWVPPAAVEGGGR